MQDNPSADYFDGMNHYPGHIWTRNKLLCYLFESDCMAEILSNKSDALKLITMKNHFITRYLQLISHDVFETVQKSKMETYMPDFRPVLNSQKLFHIQLLITSNTATELLNVLSNEIKDLRRLLVSADDTTIKSVITGMLHESIEFVNQLHQRGLIRLKPETLSHLNLLPLKQNELSNYKAMKNNYEMAIRVFHEVTHSNDRSKILGEKHMNLINQFLMKFFYQPNMTLNSIYQNHTSVLIEFSQLNILKQINTNIEEQIKLEPDNIRNPMGAKIADMITFYSIPSNEYTIRTFAINSKIKLLTALVKEGSAEMIINKAQNGYTDYLNPIDQSIPFKKDNKLCFSGPYERNANYRCLVLVN